MADYSRQKKYLKEKRKVVTICFDKEKDSDIITRIEGMNNKHDYICKLVRKDIAETGKAYERASADEEIEHTIVSTDEEIEHTIVSKNRFERRLKLI